MAWYRRLKFASHVFRNFSSTIVPKPPIQPPVSRIPRNYPFPPAPFNNSMSRASPISRALGFDAGSGRSLYTNPFTGTLSRRFYFVDGRQIQHFRPRGYSRWVKNPRTLFGLAVIGSGIVVTVYFGNTETIPYTKRKHFVILSKNIERHLGESQFEQMKASFKGKILPAIHPESIRVRLIATDIVEALQRGLKKELVWTLQRGLKKELVWTDLSYTSEHSGSSGGRRQETLHALSSDPEGGGGWSKEDEILDDKWVQQSRQKGMEKGASSATGHLEGVKWEVLVVNEPVVNAFCLPGGKIVVFTGLLKHFRTDAELATIIGHEVAHAVARHSAEQITKNLWLTIVQLILYQFVTPDIVNTMSNLLLKLPFSRRMELEADYIGLLLMASAGYDPRVAPSVFKKLGEISGDSTLRDYLSTHPSGKKRAELLMQAKVMEEALGIYRDSMAGREVEGFFL